MQIFADFAKTSDSSRIPLDFADFVDFVQNLSQEVQGPQGRVRSVVGSTSSLSMYQKVIQHAVAQDGPACNAPEDSPPRALLAKPLPVPPNV